MKRLILLGLMLCGGQAYGLTNCALSGSPTQVTLQGALTAAGTSSCTGTASGSTVQLAGGSTTVTSALSVPANVTVTGPVVPLAAYTTGDAKIHMGYTPTARITGNLGRTAWLMSISSGDTIEYLEFDGQTPTTGGGNIYVPAGSSNVTITRNYFHGNQTTNMTCCGDRHDSLVWMDGDNPANNAQNDTVSWNKFGASGNCSNIMQNTFSCDTKTQTCSGSGAAPSYQGSSAAQTGGYCEGLGIHTGATNLLVTNNVFYSMEQGLKQYTGTNSNTSFCNLCTIQNNDFSTIHRIAFETQINPGAGSGTGSGSAETIKFNSYHDPYYPFYGSFGISAANGVTGATNSTFNVLVANQCPISPAIAFAMADELYGHGSISSNNLIQGCFDNGIQYNYDATFQIQNNNFCGTGGNQGRGLEFINRGVPPTYGNVPTVSGNTPSGANTINNIGSTTCTATASTAPVISPSSGAWTFPLTVTLTDSGANTGIWYTTDGSTPVPGTGTAAYLSTGGTLVLNSAATVNAVGMWGAANQPASYPSGYGFTPSSMVTEKYTSAGAVVMGNSTDNSPGTTAANYFNDVYAVTGSNFAGYTVNTGTVCLAPGAVTPNAKTDIGINAAPTPTTEGTTALCHGTYTNGTNTTSSPGCVTVPMTGCGTLAPNTPYWIWTITNDSLSSSPLYFSNCGGSCNGSAPTVGVGTYGGFYLHGTYGSYAGMSSTFTGGPVTGGQPSVYLNLTPSVVVGNRTDNSAGTTAANYFNDVYVVTGSDPAGYSVNTGTVCIAPGTVTPGANTDIGINTAPTTTTEGTTALCHATYTNSSSPSSPGCVTVPLTGCGTLNPNTPYWLWTITNDPRASSPLYFSNCGGSCSGSAPTTEGVGTYGGFYLHGTYGTYTGMSPAFTGGPVTGGQPSVYLGATPK